MLRHVALSLLIGVLIPSGLASAQPAIESCDQSLIPLPADAVTTRTIEIDEAPVEAIGCAEIAVTLSHAWVGSIALVTDPVTDESCEAGSVPSEPLAVGILLECLDEAVDIGLEPATVEVEVFDDPLPDEVQVVVDLTFGFIPYLDISVTSPEGVEVQLFRGDGLVPGNEDYSDMDVVFADTGTAQPVFDYDASALVQPSGPGSLEDFLDGDSVGTWELEITSNVAEAGTLDAFCMQFLTGCALERPVLDSCEILNDNALPPILLTFSGIDADVVEEIGILRNDVLVAVLDGDAVEYVDEDIPAAGRQSYRILAYDEDLDCGKPSNHCLSEPIGIFSVCDEADEELVAETLAILTQYQYRDGGGDLLPVDFCTPDDTITDEVEVSVDVDTTWAGDVDLWISSPDLTTVRLNDSRGADGKDIRVTFSDAATDTLGLFNTTCECLVLPEGPGELADFEGADPEGTWFLLALFEDYGPTTVEEWCVGVYPRLLPTECGTPHFVRGDVDNSGSVSAIPDGLRVLRWGVGNAAAPPCMLAADVDGNGVVSGIPDGLRLLFWGSGLALLPPEPFPGCGPDPDPGPDPEPCDTDGDGENDGGNTCDGDPSP